MLATTILILILRCTPAYAGFAPHLMLDLHATHTDERTISPDQRFRPDERRFRADER
jgi:hypothetical protein